jgi:creatinine amidohydrolase/Fe(II)-dependent formamide hydrolase-like protein
MRTRFEENTSPDIAVAAPWHGCWWIAEDLSDTGATGDPTRYDAELGRRIIERQTEILCDLLGEMWRGAGEEPRHG